jgi:hypothetical protein
MNRWTKAFVALIASAALTVTASAAMVAGTIAHSGLIYIKVHERHADGANFALRVPGAVLDAGLLTADLVMPEETRNEIRRDLGPHAPQLARLAQVLEDMPDAVLVTVDSANEQVRIAKVGRNVEIRVHDAQTDVEVSIPARSLRAVLDTLL